MHVTRRSRYAESVWEVVNADGWPSDDALEALAALLLDLVDREEQTGNRNRPPCEPLPVVGD